MGHEWFPLIATGTTLIYVIGVFIKIAWDEKEFEESQRKRSHEKRRTYWR